MSNNAYAQNFGPSDFIMHINSSNRNVKKAFKLPKSSPRLTSHREQLIQQISDKIFEKHKNNYVSVSKRKIYEFTQKELKGMKNIQPELIDQIEKKILDIIQSVGDATL